MRSLLVIILVVVLLLAAVWGIGFMQPLDHTASYTAIVPASQSAVWNRIADVQDQPSWRKGLTVSPAPSKNGHPCWQETAGNLPIRMCVEVSNEPRLREVGLSSPGNFRGTWTYELEPVSPDQTRVRMTETVIIEHPTWRFFMLLAGPNYLSRQVGKQLAESFGGKPQPVR